MDHFLRINCIQLENLCGCLLPYFSSFLNNTLPVFRFSFSFYLNSCLFRVVSFDFIWFSFPHELRVGCIWLLAVLSVFSVIPLRAGE